MEVPKRLQGLKSRAGTHRRGYKILVTGKAGSGKSYLAAHVPGEPGERVFIECGEGGLEQYLDPEDIVFTIESPDDYMAAIQWAVENSIGRGGPIKSVAIDPANLQWENHLDYWQDKLGHDIQGGDWRKVKAGWKKTLRDLQRSSLNVVMTCHLKDLIYRKESSVPGAEGQLKIYEALMPQIEKNVPYIVDMVLYLEVELDEKFKPTSRHRATVLKVRRPKSIDPKDLYAGKSWRFDAKKPKNPWEEIVNPIADAWKVNAEDWDEPDGPEEAEAFRELQEAGSEAEVGRLVKLIEKQTDLRQFARMWDKEIGPVLNGMTQEDRAFINKVKEQKKAQLGG